MPTRFHEALDDHPVQLPSDRSTGLVLATATAAGAAFLWSSQPRVAAAAGIVAATLLVLSLVAPATLHLLNRAWMGLAQLLARIVNPVVMGIIYLFAIIPFGLAMQTRADPLRRKPELSDSTFWIVPEINFGTEDMTRQF